MEPFYPPASRRLGEQGPVDVAFTLEKEEAGAADVEVVASSLSDRLDAAAVLYTKSMKFRTACPGTRYEMRVRFQFNE
jgi:TonB family protein